MCWDKKGQLHGQCLWKAGETQINMVWWRDGTLTIANIVSSKGNTCVQRKGFSRRRHPQKLRLHPHPLPSWNTASGWCLRERKDKQTATHRHSAMRSMSHTLRAHTFSHVHTHTDGRQRVSVEMQTLGCSSQWVPKAMFLCQCCLD